MPQNKNDLNQPLNILFLVTSMPVGGAEVLLANLVRGLNKNHFAPEIGCLKELGPLGEELASEFPIHSHLISHKYDIWVLARLQQLMRERQIDVVITVGAGDKMFWGRIAAKIARVPVIASALHSTGWPDSVGKMNRLLTNITDAFIGVADAHAKHLIAKENFPEEKVYTIYNGVDTERFTPGDGSSLRSDLGIAQNAPVVGILAALRPEKNHELFLKAAKKVSSKMPETQFLVIGDGPCRESLENLAEELNISDQTHFLGSRSDIPQLMQTIDVLALTSHNEASPVSIIEAMSCGVPVISSDVGSVSEMVIPGKTGFLFQPGDLKCCVASLLGMLQIPEERKRMGIAARESVVRKRSLEVMVQGYENLISRLYQAKCQNLPNRITAEVFSSHTTEAKQSWIP